MYWFDYSSVTFVAFSSQSYRLHNEDNNNNNNIDNCPPSHTHVLRSVIIASASLREMRPVAARVPACLIVGRCMCVCVCVCIDRWGFRTDAHSIGLSQEGAEELGAADSCITRSVTQVLATSRDKPCHAHRPPTAPLNSQHPPSEFHWKWNNAPGRIRVRACVCAYVYYSYEGWLAHIRWPIRGYFRWNITTKFVIFTMDWVCVCVRIINLCICGPPLGRVDTVGHSGWTQWIRYQINLLMGNRSRKVWCKAMWCLSQN